MIDTLVAPSELFLRFWWLAALHAWLVGRSDIYIVIVRRGEAKMEGTRACVCIYISFGSPLRHPRRRFNDAGAYVCCRISVEYML